MSAFGGVRICRLHQRCPLSGLSGFHVASLWVSFMFSCVSHFTHGIAWLAQEAEGADRAGEKRGNPNGRHHDWI
jgi:hypothetical protein